MPLNSCPISWFTKENFTQKQHFGFLDGMDQKTLSTDAEPETSSISTVARHRVNQNFCLHQQAGKGLPEASRPRNQIIRSWLYGLGWVRSRRDCPGGSAGKNPPAMREAQVPSLGWAGPLKKKWRATPVFLPGESQGQRSLAGYGPWNHRVKHDWAIRIIKPTTISFRFISIGDLEIGNGNNDFLI